MAATDSPVAPPFSKPINKAPNLKFNPSSQTWTQTLDHGTLAPKLKHKSQTLNHGTLLVNVCHYLLCCCQINSPLHSSLKKLLLFSISKLKHKSRTLNYGTLLTNDWCCVVAKLNHPLSFIYIKNPFFFKLLHLLMLILFPAHGERTGKEEKR